MATFPAPISQADTQATFGKSFEYFGDALRQEMTERFNVLDTGLFGGVFNVAGSGSLTVRRRFHGGIGGALPMIAMGSETEAISASSLTGNYDDLTVARYGLAFEETWQRALVQSDGITLDQLAASIADSWVSRLRALACVSGAAISSAAVDSSSALSLNDWATVVATLAETEGFTGQAVAILHPEQVTDLRAGLRAEPGVYNDAASFKPSQTLMPNVSLQFADLWGIAVYQSFDVTTASSKWNGFVCGGGAFAIGLGAPTGLSIPAGAQPVYMPDMGMVVTRGSNDRQAFSDVTANAWMGIGRVNTALAPQYLIKSQNN